jgi:hypothetical protein
VKAIRRLSQTQRLGLFVMLIVATTLAAVTAAGGGQGSHANTHAVAGAKSAASEPCPGDARRLPPDAIAGASEAALAAAPHLYRGKNLHDMRALQATLAVADRDRGLYPRVKCGRQFRHRAVIVYLDFPAERPSASLSQGVVVVFRAGDGYRVWAVLH